MRKLEGLYLDNMHIESTKASVDAIRHILDDIKPLGYYGVYVREWERMCAMTTRWQRRLQRKREETFKRFCDMNRQGSRKLEARR